MGRILTSMGVVRTHGRSGPYTKWFRCDKKK